MRGTVKLLTGIVLALAAAWVGLWWVTENRMQAGVMNWIGQEQANGAVRVTYDRIERGHSPLAATVTLINPSLTITETGLAAIGGVSAPSIGLRIDALSPLVLHTDWPPQMNITTPRGNLVVTFGHTAIAYSLTPMALFSPEVYPFTGEQFDLQNTAVSAGGSLPVLQIDDISGHGTVNAAASASQTALALTETANGIALSPLLTKITSMPFGGKITHFGFTTTLSGPMDWRQMVMQMNSLPAGEARRQFLIQALHGWAANGGNGTASISLTLGPSTLQADGNVTFDAKAQPDGTGTLAANHLDGLTAALVAAYPQVQNSVNKSEARLSPYLSTTSTGGQVLTIHAAYGSGAVSLNGAKVADMPPLDWAALENPPAPPPQAPGDGSGAAAGQ